MIKNTIIISLLFFALVSCNKDLTREDVIKLIDSDKYINLKGADLEGVDLSNLDLHRSDLSEANLRGADFTDTDLSGADLTNVIGFKKP